MDERETDGKKRLEEAVSRDIEGILSEHFEVSEKLSKLRDLELGRAFEFINEEKRILLAYGLPLNREQTSHVVIFADGEIITTEANGELNNLIYTHNMGASNVPFFFDRPNLEAVKRTFNLENVFRSKVTMRSSNREQTNAIRISLNDALVMGMLLKKEREEALKESPKIVVETVNFFLDSLDAPDAVDIDDLPYGPEE